MACILDSPFYFNLKQEIDKLLFKTMILEINMVWLFVFFKYTLQIIHLWLVFFNVTIFFCWTYKYFQVWLVFVLIKCKTIKDFQWISTKGQNYLMEHLETCFGVSFLSAKRMRKRLLGTFSKRKSSGQSHLSENVLLRPNITSQISIF